MSNLSVGLRVELGLPVVVVIVGTAAFPNGGVEGVAGLSVGSSGVAPADNDIAALPREAGVPDKCPASPSSTISTLCTAFAS